MEEVNASLSPPFPVVVRTLISRRKGDQIEQQGRGGSLRAGSGKLPTPSWERLRAEVGSSTRCMNYFHKIKKKTKLIKQVEL